MSTLCSIRRTLIRSGPANVRDRRLGAAAAVGQAVQAPPRALRRPQPVNARSGGAGRRGAATADQAAPAAVSLRGGEAPAAERSAATPNLATAKRWSHTQCARVRRPAARRRPKHGGGEANAERSPRLG